MTMAEFPTSCTLLRLLAIALGLHTNLCQLPGPLLRVRSFVAAGLVLKRFPQKSSRILYVLERAQALCSRHLLPLNTLLEPRESEQAARAGEDFLGIVARRPRTLQLRRPVGRAIEAN